MRLLPPIVLALGLFSSLLLLFPRGAPPTAHAQSIAAATITTTHTSTTTIAAAAAAHSLYLPLIHRGPDNPPTPTPSPTPPSTKVKSGIHLGNRGSDWREELFTLIGGGTTGVWPAAVVVQSNQLYTLTRPTTATSSNEKCWITDAEVKRTATGDHYNAFTYLSEAVDNGTKVVFRLSPSPGNFLDEVVSDTLRHTLLITETPNGGDYCNQNGNQH